MNVVKLWKMNINEKEETNYSFLPVLSEGLSLVESI